MQNLDKVPIKIIEMEIGIKLLNYLKSQASIDEEMYNYVVNKLLNKIEVEKNKIDENYKKNRCSYKLLT